jgi:hypothetical protein
VNRTAYAEGFRFADALAQIVGAAKFRTASTEIADKIRRLVEVLQSGLQVSTP